MPLPFPFSHSLSLSLISVSAFELRRKRQRNHPFRALVTRRPTSFSGSHLVPRERSFLAIFLRSLKVGRPACPMQFNYCNATPRRATPSPLGIPANVFVVTEAFSFSLFPSSRSIFFSFSPCVFHSVQRLSYSSDASAVKGQSAGVKLSEFKSNQRYGALNQKGRPMKPRLHLIISYRIAAREPVR